MFNPRHSFISTASATTYPSTLSPPRSSSALLTSSPTSPRQNHPHRLHRSSKRNLRVSASSSALKAIVEDGRGGAGKTLSHRMSALTLAQPTQAPGPMSRPSSSSMTSQSRPSLNLTPTDRPPTRPAPVESVQAWARHVNQNQKASSRPTSTVQQSNSTVKPKHPKETTGPQPPTQLRNLNQSTGLGLVTGPPARQKAPTQPTAKSSKTAARVAQPRKPEPIDVNPKRQDSFADEWERELLQSAKNPHFELPESKGKGREVQKDIEWERSGRWQADVDPTREAEDMKRRDNGREIGE